MLNYDEALTFNTKICICNPLALTCISSCGCCPWLKLINTSYDQTRYNYINIAVTLYFKIVCCLESKLPKKSSDHWKIKCQDSFDLILCEASHVGGGVKRAKGKSRDCLIWNRQTIQQTHMGSHSFYMKCFLSGGIQKLHASLKLPAAEASSLRGVFRLPWSPWQRSSSGRPLWRKASSGLHPDQRKTGPVKGVPRLISFNAHCGIKLKVLK